MEMTTCPFEPGSWLALYWADALSAGFNWTRRSILDALGPLIGVGAFDPDGPLAREAWVWWLRHGPDFEEHPRWLSPKHFAEKAAYWQRMVTPAETW